MKHLIHVLVVVALATFGTLTFGIGATFTGSLISGILYSAITACLIVGLGVGSLIFARSKLGLAQAGILLQMILFWLYMWIALAISPAQIISTVHGWLASAVILGAVVVMAKLTGGFSSSFKRSWLPVRAKRKQ